MLLQQSIEHLFCIVSVHVIYSRVSGQIICAHTITVLRTIPSLPFQALLNGDSDNVYNNNTTGLRFQMVPIMRIVRLFWVDLFNVCI